MCTGSLLSEIQGTSNSRWEKELIPSPEGPGNQYPKFVILHLSSTKTGPKEDRLEAYQKEPALCPIYALWCYCRLLKRLRRLPDNENSCLFVSNNLQTAGQFGKVHTNISSPETIAKDTAKILKDAGIDTDTFHAHALRGSTASKYLDAGASECDVMAKGGWLSNSVFQTFYARTRLQNVSLDKIRQTNTGPVATDKEGQSSARAAQSDTPNSGTPSDPIVGAETTYKLGPHSVDSNGIELKVPGSGMKDGVKCYCHACWGADTSTLLYCKSCNKHLHKRHFEDPEESVAIFRSQGWICDECQ